MIRLEEGGRDRPEEWKEEGGAWMKEERERRSKEERERAEEERGRRKAKGEVVGDAWILLAPVGA